VGADAAVGTIPTVLDHDERTRWRTAADEKLRTAELLRTGDRHADACVLYEQCCQLALKGVLRGFGRADRTHDLDTLARAVSEESGRAVDEALAAQLSALARDYIPARYPDAYDTGTPDTHYSSADSVRASSTAARALAWADEVWEALVEESLLPEAGDGQRTGSLPPEES
jgi:HEPN domain-containing protein